MRAARIVPRVRRDAGDPVALVVAGRVRVGGRPVTDPRALVPAHEPLAIDAAVERRDTRTLRAREGLVHATFSPLRR